MNANYEDKTQSKLTRGRRLGASAPPYTPPYTVQGSCELSEDYFLSAQVIINPDTDLVRPFTRADGTVEALVLSGGNLAYLQSDPTATSGWTYTDLSNQIVWPIEISDLAVGTHGDGTVSGILISPSGSNTASAYALDFDPSTSTWSAPEWSVPANGLGRFQTAVDPGGVLYFYAWDASSTLHLYTPTIASFGVVSLSFPAAERGFSSAWALWDWNYSPQTSASCGVMLDDGKGNFKWFPQTGANSCSSEYSWMDGPSYTLLWAGRSQTQLPAVVYQDTYGITYYYNGTQGQNPPITIGTNSEPPQPVQLTAWQTGGLYSFALLVGDTVYAVTQYGTTPGQPPLMLTVPLQPGVMTLFNAPSNPSQTTLFVLLADSTLSVLAKDPAAGWSLVPVIQDSATLQELDGWRVQLTATDANGVSVTGASLSVTTDRPIGVWQGSGNTLLSTQEPTTFTTDAHGRVTFATPAVELDTAQLTVQVVSVGGSLTASEPATVSPDADVHAFLGGTAPLTDLGTLTPTALLTATKADGTPLCPVLTSAPADSQVSGASAVISAMNQCIQAGQGVTPGPDDIKSFVLDMTGVVPTFISSIQPGGVPVIQSSLTGWWDDIEHDFDSFAHGVRHKATQIAKCSANWLKDEGDEAYHWVVNLAIGVGNDIAGVVSYVITDMKTALHAVTAFFQAIGAAIGDAIYWLRHNIGDLIKEAGQNAAQVEQWLAQLPATANAQLTRYGKLAQGFFTGLETTIDTRIDALMPQLGGQTMGSLPPPPSAALDIAKFLSGAQHNWLLDKIESFFNGDKQPTSIPALQDALDQLATAVQEGLQAVEDIGELLWTGLQVLFASQGSYGATTCTQLFTVLKSTVHDLLAFADALVQALIDLTMAAMDQLGAMLGHQINDIPLVGSVLKLFGIDPTMSVAHLVSLVLMYPATLANRIKNGSDATLFPATGQQLAAAQLDWAAGLQISAAVGQGIWGFADAAGDTYRVADEEPSGMIGWIDIVSPLVLTILEWPGEPNSDGTTAPPFANNIDSAGPDGAMIWPNWLLNFVPPIAGLCGQFADYKPAALAAVEDEEPQWPEIGQYFTMVSAIAETVLSSIYNWGTDQSGSTKAAGILSNISNVIAPFATSDLAAETEGASEVIKLCVDFAGNIGAAVAMGV